MANAKEISIKDRRITVLVIGESGTGKTHIIGTYPGLCYVFDTDDGMVTLRGMDVEYDTYKDDPQKPMAYVNAQRQLQKFQTEAKKSGKVMYNDRIIDCVALDSSSGMLDACLQNVLFGKGALDKLPASFTWATEYAPQSHAYWTFVKGLLSLPCSVIVTAHEQTKEDDLTKDVKVWPALIGQLRSKIGASFDLVLRCEAKPKSEGTVYKVLTQNQGYHTAKSRFREVLDLREKPDLAYMLDKVRKSDEGGNSDRKKSKHNGDK